MKITVEVPDGLYCEQCKFMNPATRELCHPAFRGQKEVYGYYSECNLFGSEINSTGIDELDKIVKCDDCLRYGDKHDNG